MEKLLTVKEVSAILNIGKTNTYKLFEQRDFPKITIGKKLMVKETDLENYLTKYTKGVIQL